MALVSPRIKSSYTVWLKNKWTYAVKEAKTIYDEGYIEEPRQHILLETYGVVKKKLN